MDVDELAVVVGVRFVEGTDAAEAVDVVELVDVEGDSGAIVGASAVLEAWLDRRAATFWYCFAAWEVWMLDQLLMLKLWFSISRTVPLARGVKPAAYLRAGKPYRTAGASGSVES